MNLKPKTFLVAFVSAVFFQFATGSAHAYYNPQTGRWLSRDPVGEPGFQALQAANGAPQLASPGSASLPPGRWFSRNQVDGPSSAGRQASSLVPKNRPVGRIRYPSGNGYAFVNNQPPNLVDVLGLTTWRGKCSFISAGEFIGGMVIDCDLVSFCEVGDDNHREYAHVLGFILDLTVSIPIEVTVSDNTFKSPGKTGYKAFRGSAAIANIGWATGPVGFALYKIKLGDGVSGGIGSEQLGLALGETAGFGFSISKGTKQCCNEK
jgi:hypothetical protein